MLKNSMLKYMKISARTLLLFTVIILEGYVVLSSELLAIRQTIPFVGSGTDTVSIIIAAILMPLAFGYYAGGQFKPGIKKKHYRSIRKKLISNIFIAQLILLIGLSYMPLTIFFYGLINLGIDHRLALTTLYSALFLVIPVYLLGQTIPLASNYFSKEKLSQITGRILFFSTMGSFMGAVFSTLILMAIFGVHHTVSIVFIILTLLIVLLSKDKTSEIVLYSFAALICSLIFNSDYVMNIYNIVEDNQYNTIMVFEDDEGKGKKTGNRSLYINHNNSSMFNNNGRKHHYVEFAERMVIDPIFNTTGPKNILVIGAGGFTFGYHDLTNHYDYVDIDKSLRSIAEEYIIKDELSANKSFHPVPARAYLTKTDKKYDVVLLDAYLGNMTIPEHLVTQEFFKQVKTHLKDNGIVIANFITSPNFSNRFSRHIDNTFRSVFPYVSRHVVDEGYNPWSNYFSETANVMYIYRNHPGANSDYIYTDNKNTLFFDKPQRR